MKDRDEHHLYSDAADRLHLRCCSSQNSTESQRAVLGRFWPQKRAPQPEPAPKKLDIIFHRLPRLSLLIQSNACMCIKTCSKKPLSIVVIIRGICFYESLCWVQEKFTKLRPKSSKSVKCSRPEIASGHPQWEPAIPHWEAAAAHMGPTHD